MTVVSLLFASKAFALEVTQYTVSLQGMFHNVTVAFDDLGQSGNIRCVIRKEGKPIGMNENFIAGVGTIVIEIPGGVTGKTQASCHEVKKN